MNKGIVIVSRLNGTRIFPNAIGADTDGDGCLHLAFQDGDNRVSYTGAMFAPHDWLSWHFLGERTDDAKVTDEEE